MNESKILERVVKKALSGEGAHVANEDLFTGVDWRTAGVRPANTPHSIYEIMTHIAYWEDWGVKWLEGKKPLVPKHAAGCWPKNSGPKDASDWKRAVQRYRRIHKELEKRAVGEDPLSDIRGKTRIETLQALASHSSYHIGQVVVLRQMLGAWPPPTGGLTW